MPEVAGSSKRTPRDARCVVWHERGADLKPELLAALARPGFSVVKCDDEFAAVANVCRFAREVGQPAASDKGAGALVILLLVDPKRLAAVAGVVEALGRYAPSAAVWMYDLSSSPQLRTVRPQDVAQWRRAETMTPEAPSIVVKAKAPISPLESPAAPAQQQQEKPAAPTIEVPAHGAAPAGMTSTAEPPSGGVPIQNQPPSRLLTDDELAMLLDIDTTPEKP